MSKPYLLTRRKQLGLMAGLTAAAGCAAGPSALITGRDPIAGDRLYQDLKTYTAFGPKQMATDADHRTSRWIHAQAAATGAKAQLSPFRAAQFRLDRASLTVGGADIQTHPFWFPIATSGTVTGKLKPLDRVGAGEIAVALPPPGTGGLRQVAPAIVTAKSRDASGVIIVSTTPSGELFGHGQETPVGVPTLLVGSKDRAIIDAAISSGAPASMEIAGRLDPQAEAFNVIARIEGDGPLVVISTPSSAWFASAGERGPGVALWLGLMRWAINRQKRPNMLFVAFSGHEMRAAGARSFVESGARPEPKKVAIWMHLGASIATYAFVRDPVGRFVSTGKPSTQARLLTNTAEFEPALARNFSTGTPLRPQLAARPEDARGELQLYFGEGYRAVGFEGSHDWFHNPGDLDYCSGPELLEPVARAITATFTDLGVIA